jgi:sugar lactone lactonase YvrE
VWAEFLDRPAVTINDAVDAGAPLLDGIALDAEGAIWAGDAAGAAALRIVEGGEVTDRVETGPQAPYAVALGDADGRTLYLACARPYGSGDPRERNVASILTARVGVPAAT